MFYIATVKNKENTIRDVFHNPELKIIPKITNNKVELYCELYLYADIVIPNNSLLLDLETNFGTFQNIPLNVNYDRKKNYNIYFESKFYFNLADNKELTKKIHENTPLEFYPKLKVDKDVFNAVNLTPSEKNVNYFIEKISFVDKKQLVSDKYYYSNFYSLHDLSIKNINKNQINKPGIEVPIFNKTINYNYWVNLHNFINFYFVNNQKLPIEWLELKIDYSLFKLNSNKKVFSYKYVNNQENNLNTQIAKDSLFTNFDYEKNEIILSDKLNGYSGIFIPFSTKGIMKLSFKINNITYYQNFDFILNQDLFGDDAKFKLKVSSDE